MQDTKIEVMWKNDISAIVSVQDNKVNVQYLSSDPMRCLFPQKPMDVYTLMHFLETRCYPRNRNNIADILKHFGLTSYDPLAMCRITHGLMRNDYLWLRFDDEPLEYNDVKIREG